MAKGQQRSNREMKKPKADKKAAPLQAPVSLTKQVTAAASTPKKKG